MEGSLLPHIINGGAQNRVVSVTAMLRQRWTFSKRLVRLIVASAQEIACLTRIFHSARMRPARLGASNADFSQKVRNQCAQDLRLSHSSRIDFCPSALPALSRHVRKFYEKGEWKHVPQTSTSPVNTGC